MVSDIELRLSYNELGLSYRGSDEKPDCVCVKSCGAAHGDQSDPWGGGSGLRLTGRGITKPTGPVSGSGMGVLPLGSPGPDSCSSRVWAIYTQDQYRVGHGLEDVEILNT